jgi:hypothetical protein
MKSSPPISDEAREALSQLDPTGKTEVLLIDEIVPYWRNPRRIPQEAVNALAASLKEYGYNQPIVVDSAKVIIIGHTRYAAMRKMGVTSVEVLKVDLDPKLVKELRVLDNRIGELTSWDFNLLGSEIAELDSATLRSFFPEVEIPGDILEPTAPTYQDQLEELEAEEMASVDTATEFVCPKCFHSFVKDVTREAIMKGLIE